MENKGYIARYGKKEVIERAKRTQALQAGGQAPEGAPQGQEPQGQQAQGGQQQVDPKQIAMAYVQAKQSGDQENMIKAAVMFMDAVVVPSLQQQAQAGSPAMRRGGEVEVPSFDENGVLK